MSLYVTDHAQNAILSLQNKCTAGMSIKKLLTALVESLRHTD
jgi:hypothetical protein